ncbi:MAG: hypothetical protein ABI759_01425 [Candidatus Solibacter sp.]
MKSFRLFVLVAAAVLVTGNIMAADRAEGGPSSAVAKLPPVLRPLEPADNRQVTLPGPKPVVPAIKKLQPMAPTAKTAPISSLILEDYALRQPIPIPVVHAALPKAPVPPPVPATVPASESAKPSPSASVPGPAAGAVAVREFAALCQKQIGLWKESDARTLLGAPLRQRSAYDDKKAVNGTIYAYQDPSNKYKELELDFDKRTGTLRTVFAYPPRLTWQECRRQWTGPISAADAAQGRKFYSYTNRRLDVLVDPAGKVISLGWY